MEKLLDDHQSKLFRMEGHSMYPCLRDGDFGLVQSCDPEKLQTGEILVFKQGDRFVAHRLVKIFHKEGKKYFLTQGDKNFHPDAAILAEAVAGLIRSFYRKDELYKIKPRAKLASLAVVRYFLIFLINIRLRLSCNIAKLTKQIKSLNKHIPWLIINGGKSFWLSLFIALFQGILPFALIYCIKLLVDVLVQTEASAAAGLNSSSNFWPEILPVLMLTAALFLTNALLLSIRTYYDEKLSLSLSRNVHRLLHQKHAELKLEYYENHKMQDKMQRAVQEAGFRPAKMTNALLSLVRSLASIAVIMVLFISLKWYLVLILLIAILPGVLLRLKYVGRRYAQKERHNPMERKMNYFNRILTGFPFAKELRLFGFSAFFRQGFSGIEKDLHSEKLKLHRSGLVADIIASVFAILCLFAALAYVVYLKSSGALSLGSVVLFFFVFQRGFAVLSESFRAATSLLEDNMYIGDLMEFLQLPKGEDDPPNSRLSAKAATPLNLRQGIHIEHLSFSYPGSRREALKDISLTIPAGQTIAFVGANGSGKSTLIKLLCGFYVPDRGEIRYDDLSIAAIGAGRLRQNITAVFQDFALYNIKAGENIALGDFAKKPDFEKIRQAADKAGIAEILEALPESYDSMLGPLFKNGEELSIGQWQKIAIARAFYREAGIVFMDEPSSALDINSERQLLESLKQLAKNKTVVIVSHRLSTVRWADRIFVFDKGCLTESGKHEELINKKGSYFRMFESGTVG